MINCISVESEFSAVTFNVSPDAQKRVDRLRSQRCCLGCERQLAPNAIVRRGLCAACYQAVVRALVKRKTTKQALMREGKLLPRSKGGRAPQNKFSAELSQM